MTHPVVRGAAIASLFMTALIAQNATELRFCIQSDPKTFNPLAVADEASETIRYLTGGVLIRFNRQIQQFQAELAESWKVEENGRRITFRLRKGLRFSDGTPLSAADVVRTFKTLLDPNLHSPAADAFRSGGASPTISALDNERIGIAFQSPITAIETLFDSVPVIPAGPAEVRKSSLGPFFVADYKPGVEVLLNRNPYYWKRDSSGRALPHFETVRLYIQQNRETELVRFRRGELDLINNLGPDQYDQLAGEMPGAVRDMGASLDAEVLFFNQVETAPLPPHKRAWFRSSSFRHAISESINRADLCRLVYRGHAIPAGGPVSPVNRFWANPGVRPHAYNPDAALKRLTAEGFRLDGSVLRDGSGNAVEFSVVTNSGNKAREKMALMLQQDLRRLGIRMNLVTLDFPSLIERITRTFRYEACLLGLTNIEIDPNGQMNLWLSSASNHQWNPNQAKPQTEWEAEIDRLMLAQASAATNRQRKASFDRVQEIVSREAPFVYLVHRNALAAVAPQIRNVSPVSLRPQVYWNVEVLDKLVKVAAVR